MAWFTPYYASRLKEEIRKLRKGFKNMKVKDGMDSVLNGISEHIGIDPEDENFKDTPERVAKLYKEMFWPPSLVKSKLEEIFTKVFPTNYSGMILIPDILTHSMCPHHMLPVEYYVTIGYLPKEWKEDDAQNMVLGLSKPVRIAKILAKQPVLQETYTQEIANQFMKISKGVAVVTVGIHNCMRCRGVETQSPAVMSVMVGPFMDDPKVREEFFFLLNHGRTFIRR